MDLQDASICLLIIKIKAMSAHECKCKIRDFSKMHTLCVCASESSQLLPQPKPLKRVHVVINKLCKYHCTWKLMYEATAV